MTGSTDSGDTPDDDRVKDRYQSAADELASQVFAGISIEDLIEKLIGAAMGKTLKGIAEEAFENALTPEMLDSFAQQADEAVKKTLNPESDDDHAADDAEPEPPETIYGSVDEFVREKICEQYRRAVGGSTERIWPARWWTYPEAVSRLEALWRAWEHSRLDATTGMSVWWRDHADHHMNILFAPDGPFADSRGTNTTRPGEPLPYEAPPAAMFPDTRPSRQPRTPPAKTHPAPAEDLDDVTACTDCGSIIRATQRACGECGRPRNG